MCIFFPRISSVCLTDVETTEHTKLVDCVSTRRRWSNSRFVQACRINIALSAVVFDFFYSAFGFGCLRVSSCEAMKISMVMICWLITPWSRGYWRVCFQMSQLIVMCCMSSRISLWGRALPKHTSISCVRNQGSRLTIICFNSVHVAFAMHNVIRLYEYTLRIR